MFASLMLAMCWCCFVNARRPSTHHKSLFCAIFYFRYGWQQQKAKSRKFSCMGVQRAQNKMVNNFKSMGGGGGRASFDGEGKKSVEEYRAPFLSRCLPLYPCRTFVVWIQWRMKCGRRGRGDGCGACWGVGWFYFGAMKKKEGWNDAYLPTWGRVFFGWWWSVSVFRILMANGWKGDKTNDARPRVAWMSECVRRHDSRETFHAG